MSNLLIPPNHRILLIDDNPAIHEDYRKIFRTVALDNASPLHAAEAALFGDVKKAAECAAFEIVSAFQGQEALGKVREALRAARPFAMAFIDMRMPPGWDGLETTLRLWEVCPDLQVVICTAYSDYSWEEMLARLGRTDRLVLLKKPFDNLEVLQLAHALTEKWRLGQEALAQTEELGWRVVERTRELQDANEKLQEEMAERARVEEAFRQAQKMEAIGQLAGGVAHDFNNILSVIRGHASLLMNEEHLSVASLESVRELDSAAERAATLTRQLLTFSRKQVMQPECLEVNGAVQDVTKLLRRLLGEDIALEIEAGEGVPEIRADRGMIEQMLINLAVNARDAMANGGRLLVRTEAVELDTESARRDARRRAGRFACLSVIDSGCGIAPETMPHLFEPFFTTKEVGKGTGLGLATVYGIAKQHEGWVEVESKPGQGAAFKVFLPESAKPVEDAPRHGEPARPRGGKETILLVEDDAALRHVLQLVLQTYGYRILVASSGVEALQIWPEHAEEIDVLVTDMVMPDGMSGRELIARLKAQKPGLRVILCSGYSRDLLRADARLDEELNFLPKPYTPVKLANAVRKCLDGRAVPRALSATAPV